MKFLFFQAYDGTGVITVHYKKQKGKDYKAAQFEHYQINKAKDFNADAETRGSEQCTFRDNGGLTSAGQIESLSLICLFKGLPNLCVLPTERGHSVESSLHH